MSELLKDKQCHREAMLLAYSRGVSEKGATFQGMI